MALLQVKKTVFMKKKLQYWIACFQNLGLCFPFTDNQRQVNLDRAKILVSTGPLDVKRRNTLSFNFAVSTIDLISGFSIETSPLPLQIKSFITPVRWAIENTNIGNVRFCEFKMTGIWCSIAIFLYLYSSVSSSLKAY